MNTSEQKKLKEYKPPVSVLSTNRMQGMLNEEQRKRRLNADKQNYTTWAISCGIIFFTNMPILLKWKELSGFSEYVYFILAIVALIFFVVFSALGYKMKCELKPLEKDGDLLDIEKVTEATQYTIIMVIGDKEKASPHLSFLCRKSDAFLEHCNAVDQKTIDENKDTVKSHLRDSYNVFEDEILDIRPIGEEPYFSVKPVHGEICSHAFIVYGLQFHKTAREKILKKISKSTEMEWLSVEEMKTNPSAIKHNYDIIEYLESKIDYLKDSFPREEMHIIWNITKSCNYTCEICATRDEKRDELSLREKLSILNSFSQDRDRIHIIDFAGGDPCTDVDSRNIIQAAIAILGQSSVSVTTTAKGINGLAQEDKQRILGTCELTIDASHESLRRKDVSDEQPSPSDGQMSESDDMTMQKLTTHRGGSAYSNENYEGIPLFRDVVKELTINIPILDDDLDDDEIETLVNKVQRIRVEHPDITLKAHLLRFMRVGSAQVTDIDTYKKYDPIPVARKIYYKLVDKEIPCSYHCSLRLIDGLGDKSKGCTMMRRKIGIDCAGNVFACAWGGYLPCDNVKNNPFYLGNLTENELADILDLNSSDNYKKLDTILGKSKVLRFCPVVSIACGGGLKRDENEDPLAKKYNSNKTRKK